ncbi:MAG: hypothetical protein KY460_08440 [Actinobacteria bacterium]|nr:hypothetical protein [Actinomycetota bacterium]
MGAIVAVVVISVGCTAQPRHLDRVFIANPTVYPMHVEVSTPERYRWLGLGHVMPSATAEFAEAIDQGPRWAVRFRYVDCQDTVVVDRGQLADRDDPVSVPVSVERCLRDAGVPAS